MSGIFSLFSGSRSGHQTTQSTTTIQDEREAQVAEKGDPLATTSRRGFEVDSGFRPVEHPVEPINQDQPVRCPLSEPSILNVRIIADFLIEEMSSIAFDKYVRIIVQDSCYQCLYYSTYTCESFC
ncbi:uncharacterized protein LOC110107710 isoform X3 [Dendrobium catenatum]|uniref:uncharacterized protein LOC110107710 isoform X3 n=1 Tax=Dendrobium catenatum TaxID=906689 RepID=UPI0009F49199|nr:uncharacterized protein LOC110107710 isoform X3 [Dendrobium catenatum]